MTTDDVSRKKEKIFVVFLAFVVAVTNLFQVLYYIPKQPPDTVMIGITHWYEDYFYYLSHLTQGARGAWLVSNAYTTEPIPPSLNWIFNLMLGKIGGFVGAQPWVTYDLSVFFLTITYVLVMYAVLFRIFPDQRRMRIGGLVIALISNSFFTVNVIGNSLTVVPFEYFYNYTAAFNRLGGVAHHIMQNILSLALISVFADILSLVNQQPRKPIIRKSLIASFLLTAMFLINPVFAFIDGLVITVVSAGYIIRFKKRALTQHVLTSIGMLALPIFPLLLLQLKTFSHAFYQYFISWETNMPPTTVPIFILSTGALAVLAPMGIVRYLKRPEPLKILGLAYAAVPIVLYFSPVPGLLGLPYFRILQPPAYVFLGALGVYGMQTISLWFSKRVKVIAASAFFAIIFSTFTLLQIPVFWEEFRAMANDYLLVSIPNFIHKDVYLGLQALNRFPKNTVVLADNYLELFVPVVSGHTVYYGHRSLTYDYATKQTNASRFFSLQMNQVEAQTFVTEDAIGAVVLQIDNGDFRIFQQRYPFLAVTYQNPKIVIFTVL